MTAEERLIDSGCCGVKYITDSLYDDALIGVTHDRRAVYDYSKMVDCCVQNSGMTVDEAYEYIEERVLKDLQFMGDDRPIIMYRLEV